MPERPSGITNKCGKRRSEAVYDAPLAIAIKMGNKIMIRVVLTGHESIPRVSVFAFG